MIKKILILLTGLCLFTQIFAVGVVGVGATETATNSSAYAMEVLTGLGMLDSGFSPSLQISRADFVKMIIVALGHGELPESQAAGQQVFIDVPRGHEAESSISIATGLGLINGFGDGTFRPDEIMSYQGAVKVVVSMLGYGPQAEVSGGFPTGYFVTAVTLGVLKGVEQSMDAELTGGVIAQMLYNSLEVRLRHPVGFSANEITHTISDSNTLLSYNKIVIHQGLIEATSQTSLAGDSTLSAGRVRIGGVEFIDDQINAAKYLGYRVKVYAKDRGNEEYAVVFVDTVKYRNEVLTLNNENIVSVDAESLEYEINGVARNVELRAIDCIYNGNAYPDYTPEDLKPQVGNITLLDNNGDSKYDVIFVRNYETYVVSSVSITMGTISDKLGKSPLILDSGDNTYTFGISHNDVSVGIDSLKQWDVLSVARSKSGKKARIEIVVSQNKVSGVIEEVTEKSGRTVVTINGNQHYVLSQFPEDVKPGDGGTYLADVLGNIVYPQEEGGSGWAYGLILGKNLDNNSMESIQIKLLESDGVITTYDLAQRVTLDGVRFSQSQLKTGHNNLKVAPKHLIAYLLDESDQIAAIETPYNQNSGARIKVSSPMGERKYNKNVPVFMTAASMEDTVAVRGDTLVFVAPSLEEDGGGFDDDDYLVRTTAYFIHDEPYEVELYNTNDFKETNLVLTSHKETSTFPNSTRPILIEKVVKTQNADGAEAYKIYGWSQGNEYQAVCATNMIAKPTSAAAEKYTLPEELMSGDVVRVLKNFAGEVNYIERGFRYAERKSYFATSDNYDGEPMYSYGEILAVTGSNLLIATGKDPYTGELYRLRHYNIHVVPVAIHDGARSKAITTGTLSDVYVGLKVFLRSSDGYVSDVYVYENVE